MCLSAQSGENIESKESSAYANSCEIKKKNIPLNVRTMLKKKEGGGDFAKTTRGAQLNY